MATKFMIGGDTVNVVNLNDETALDELQPKLYTVERNQAGYYLRVSKDKLEIPDRIYGNAMTRVAKCVNTYLDRDTSTGFLLTGDKGTGKSLLMALLVNEAISALNMPVIMIKQAYAGTEFYNFIDLLGECVLVFDEFGKMYSSSKNGDSIKQTELLSLMDGVEKSKRMFIMTENDEYDIDDFILDRPSRVYYHFKYNKLDEDSIKDFCDDYGVEKNIIEDILHISRKSKLFSFDILQTIVEEYLRYKGPIEDVIGDLNINLSERDETMIEILEVFERDTDIRLKVSGTNKFLKPSQHNDAVVTLRLGESREDNTPQCCDMDDDFAPLVDTSNNTRRVYIESSDLIYEKNGKLVYETGGLSFITREVEPTMFDYSKVY